MKMTMLPLLSFLFFLTTFAQNNKFTDLNADQFNQGIARNNGILLDVRTESEYNNGHIAHAGQLNYYAFDFNQKLLLLQKDLPIYLYCNTGYRSKKAAEILTENGYTHVFNLQHGIMEWNLQNLPIVIDPDARPDLDNKMDMEQFSRLIHSDSLVFIDFYAPWCAPCRNMMPMMDSLTIEFKGRITIVKVNADASKKLVKALRLTEVPFLALYYKGKVLYSKTGTIDPKELTLIFLDNIRKYSTDSH